MADTSAYKKIIEDWFRTQYLPSKHKGCEIKSGGAKLIWGGTFQYDALVYKGASLVAVYCLSCSEYKTHGGKGGAGKFNKIKGDILMMVGTECPNKVLEFSGITMLEKVKEEQKSGRLPNDIQCELVELPQSMLTLVETVSAASVKEVTPDQKTG